MELILIKKMLFIISILYLVFIKTKGNKKMIKSDQVVTTKNTIIVDDEGIIFMLQKLGYLPKSAKNIRVIFSVPGGGDYSNIDLELSKSLPLTIKFNDNK